MLDYTMSNHFPREKDLVLRTWSASPSLPQDEIDAYKEGLLDSDIDPEIGNHLASIHSMQSADLGELNVIYATQNLMRWIAGYVAYHLILSCEADSACNIIAIKAFFMAIKLYKVPVTRKPPPSHLTPSEARIWRYRSQSTGIVDQLEKLTTAEAVVFNKILTLSRSRSSDSEIRELAAEVQNEFWSHYVTTKQSR